MALWWCLKTDLSRKTPGSNDVNAMRLSPLIAAISCVLLLLVSGVQTQAQKTKTKILHFAAPTVFNGNYDPAENNIINLYPLFRSIYSTLFKLDIQARPYPFLLESFKKDGKRVTFTLKPSARFSDGSPITVNDVIRSIEKGIAQPSFPSPVYKVIEGGEELFRGKTNHCKGLRNLGPHSLEITLVEENAEFTHYFASSTVSILPAKRKKAIKHMAFSGPYRVIDQIDMKSMTMITLERNIHFIGEPAKIDRLVFYLYKQHKEFVQAIYRGEPDLFLYNRDYKMPQSRYRYSFYKIPTAGSFYFKLNPTSGPFRDKSLRSFFKSFILTLGIAGSSEWSLSAPSPLILPYGLTGHEVFTHLQAEKLEKLMPKKPITITSVNSRTGIRPILLPILKKKLKKYNINLELQWNSMDKIQELEKQRKLDLTSYYYLVEIPLSSYFYENLFIPGHELNLFGYKLPQALELLEEYRKQGNGLVRLRILNHLEKIAQEEAFLVPVLNPLALLGYKRYVKNAKLDSFLNIFFEEIDVK